MCPQAAQQCSGQGACSSQTVRTGDVFDRIQQTYGEIARRAFEIFEITVSGSVTTWRLVPCRVRTAAPVHLEWQSQMTT